MLIFPLLKVENLLILFRFFFVDYNEKVFNKAAVDN